MAGNDASVMVIAGDHAAVGRQLGELARPVMADYLAQSRTWQTLQLWRNSPLLTTVAEQIRYHQPGIWQELTGMAEALAMPPADVLLWHCRGDLLHAVNEGCTTIAARCGDTLLIAHNEDGDPFLRDRCRLVDVRIEGRPRLVSFYYPGSLPGHTFAVNAAGLVQTINNVRLPPVPGPGLPRQILARAVLDCTTLDEAVALLRDSPRSGGFHHTLACAGDARLFSIEAVPAGCSVREIGERFGHANHLIHEHADRQLQIVTRSSAHRQARIDRLAAALPGKPTSADLRAALLDRSDPELPVFRTDPDDPDDEITLACAVFELSRDAVTMRVFDREESAGSCPALNLRPRPLPPIASPGAADVPGHPVPVPGSTAPRRDGTR